MTQFHPSDRDINRAIRSWLHEDRQEDVSRIAGVVLDELDATPQRRTTWWPARRTPDMNKFLAIGLGAAAVVAVLLIGSNLLGSSSPPPGGQPSASVEPSEAPSEAEPSVAAGLPEGPHVLWDTPGEVAITVTIPAAGWFGDVGGGILLKNDNPSPPDGAGMIVFQGDLYAYGDPCQWSGTEPDSPATTAEELVTALGAQALRDASEPVDITVDGHSGKAITLHVPDDAAFNGDSFTDCDEGYFGSWTVPVGGVAGTDGPHRYHQGPGQIDEIWALDVDGGLVVIDWTHYAGTPAEDLAETRAIVESATFGE